MKNLFLSAIAVILFLSGCTFKAPLPNADQIAKDVFSKQELQCINTMISYMDKLVIEETKEKDINKAYHSLLDNIWKNYKNQNCPPALLKDSVKFPFIESFEKEDIQGIWLVDDYVQMIRTKDTTLYDLHGYKTLNINTQGHYMKYIQRLGKSDAKYKGLHEVINITGDFSPTSTGWFAERHDEYDFNIYKDRLWVTLYLLKFGDPMEEKIQRYLSNQKKH
ncbi:hypothetical protein EYV94_15670 [Puteibacter caeruleilacunae]|nr:hypothetical protein EYV94_15670 [Puteibacter caeruleilacunae]